MRIGIAGYGNIGKAVEKSVGLFPDMELFGIFTRRNCEEVKAQSKTTNNVYPFERLMQFKNNIDVVINCMGSATDLPITTPKIAQLFNVVDSFDNHHRINEHIEAVDAATKKTGTIAIVSVGWDPGLFSMNRLIMRSVLPVGKDYTFWGKGVSQGHSQAVRNLFNVVDARQYTVPVPSAVYKVRKGETPDFKSNQMHRRECYVVATDGADTEKIEKEIKSMPDYFDGFDTQVTFINYEDFLTDHTKQNHSGVVFRNEPSSEGLTQMEYSLKLSSNPSFTAKILLCYARAAYKMKKRGEFGCKTVFDVKPCDLFLFENIQNLYELL